MIFVTVGAQMPFDRMIRAIDEWSVHGRRADVVAQIGNGSFEPRALCWTRFMSPEEFRQSVTNARLVVAHAGMGSILTALELGKSILVMPRRGDLRETRNDHQIATAEALRRQGRVNVASDTAELVQQLDRLESLPAPAPIRATASPELINAIRSFIHGPAQTTDHALAANASSLHRNTPLQLIKPCRH